MASGPILSELFHPEPTRSFPIPSRDLLRIHPRLTPALVAIEVALGGVFVWFLLDTQDFVNRVGLPIDFLFLVGLIAILALAALTAITVHGTVSWVYVSESRITFRRRLTATLRSSRWDDPRLELVLLVNDRASPPRTGVRHELLVLPAARISLEMGSPLFEGLMEQATQHGLPIEAARFRHRNGGVVHRYVLHGLPPPPEPPVGVAVRIPRARPPAVAASGRR
jgi:hypothetical protein